MHYPGVLCALYAYVHICQRISAVFPYAPMGGRIADMQRPTIHSVLGHLIKSQGITPTALSRLTGVSQSTISRILNRKIEKPTDDQVSKLADYFHITTDQLRGRQPIDNLIVLSQEENGAVHREPEAVIDGPMDVWDDATPLADDEVFVPFLKEVELAAGSGRASVEINSRRKLRFGKYSLKKEGVQAEHAVAVTVRGNSMEPVLPDGATVAVNTIDKTITDGKTYAINHAGQLRVKLLYRLPGGGLRIRSYNRDEHPDEEYTPAQVQEQEISVIGRVFWGAMFF